MYARLERFLAGHGLAQELSPAQRRLAYRCFCVAAVLLISAFFSAATAIVAVIAYFVVGRILPRVDATPAVQPPAQAPGAVPPVAERPVPELVVGLDAYMKPWRDLLRGVPQGDRERTTIALLEIMEAFTADAQFVRVCAKDINDFAVSGKQPRLTKAAVDLFTKRATLCRDQVEDAEQGRFLAVRIHLAGHPDVRVRWSVRMLGTTCVYRIDGTQIAGC